MKVFARTIRTTMIYIFTLLLSVSMPISVMAEDTTVNQPTKPTYTYDSTTGRWDTDKWHYDSITGTYQPVIQPTPDPTPTPPAPTVVVQPDATPQSAAPTIITPQTDNSSVSDDQNSTATLDATNNTDVSNTVNADAGSGDATTILNTTAGNATTGDATDTATILNNVNSTLSTANNQKAASFTADVMGDVNGDIVLQPMLLKAMLESGSTDNSSTTATINNDTTLTNNVNLNATTGNAGVIGNTTAGDAKSGSANTVANVVNIINSMVAANQSFIGTVNIYGNLNGDILIAPDFIPQLIASNGSTDKDDKSTKSVTVIDAKDMQSVINNVSLAAKSGKAAVMDNTTAGSATTGDANTNVVIFNLSGHEIVASNSLLVFINVLGKWVGVIVDAPVGATAAAIGNGVTTDAIASPDLTIVSDNNSLITNNITLASQSGNATVAGNTTAGNAISGDATASANIANISNNSIGLSGWFGILFINVFGTWHGSFGIDTPYGDPVVGRQSSSKSNRVIEFIPSSANQAPTNITFVGQNGSDDYSVISMETQSGNVSVLGSGTSKKVTLVPVKNSLSSSSINLALLAWSTFIVIISAAGLNRFRIARRI